MPSASFIPKNADFEAVVQDSFGRQSFMATLGVRLTHLAPGAVDLTLPFSPDLGQQNGYLTPARWRPWPTRRTATPPSRWRPPTPTCWPSSSRSTCCSGSGNVVRRPGPGAASGRTLTVCLAEVFAEDVAAPALVATMLSTIIIRPRARPTTGAS